MLTLDRKKQKQIHDIIRYCDNSYASYLRGEAINELTELKLIEMTRDLSDEEERNMHINIEIITKVDAKINMQGWTYSLKHRMKLMMIWINSHPNDMEGNFTIVQHQ